MAAKIEDAQVTLAVQQLHQKYGTAFTRRARDVMGRLLLLEGDTDPSLLPLLEGLQRRAGRLPPPHAPEPEEDRLDELASLLESHEPDGYEDDWTLVEAEEDWRSEPTRTGKVKWIHKTSGTVKYQEKNPGLGRQRQKKEAPDPQKPGQGDATGDPAAKPARKPKNAPVDVETLKGRFAAVLSGEDTATSAQELAGVLMGLKMDQIKALKGKLEAKLGRTKATAAQALADAAAKAAREGSRPVAIGGEPAWDTGADESPDEPESAAKESEPAAKPEDTPGTMEHFKATTIDPMVKAHGHVTPDQVKRLADRYNARHGTSLDITSKNAPKSADSPKAALSPPLTADEAKTRVSALPLDPETGEPKVPFPVDEFPSYLMDTDREERLKNAASYPVGEVPIGDLIAVQGHVTAKGLTHMLTGGDKDAGLPLVVKQGGKYYLDDGTHRTVATAMRGGKSIKANVLDLDAPASARVASAPSAEKVQQVDRDTGGRTLTGGEAGERLNPAGALPHQQLASVMPDMRTEYEKARDEYSANQIADDRRRQQEKYERSKKRREAGDRAASAIADEPVKQSHEMTLADYRERYAGNYGDMTDEVHRRQVEKAIAAGLPVSPEVLADYPDLAGERLGAKGTPKAQPAAEPDARPKEPPAPAARPRASDVVSAIRSTSPDVESGDETVHLPELRKRLGLSKEEFDRAIIGEAEKGRLFLIPDNRTGHLSPQELETLVRGEDGAYYRQVGLRADEPGSMPSASDAPRVTPRPRPDIGGGEANRAPSAKPARHKHALDASHPVAAALKSLGVDLTDDLLDDPEKIAAAIRGKANKGK